MRYKIFRDEFYFFLNKFKNHDNFSLLRFSDGELFILQDREIYLTSENVKVGGLIDAKDGFYSSSNNPRPSYDQKAFVPKLHSKFQTLLMESFRYQNSNYYKGISCRCCVGNENFDWQMEILGGDNDNLTWSNVLLNSNYPIFLDEFYPEIKKRGAYVICNEMADLSHLEWVKGNFRVKTDIFENFESYILHLKEFISKNNIINEVFLFSSSSLSNIMQYELIKEFPNNVYIDIGTTLSHEFKILALRGYNTDYFNGRLGNLQTCVW